MYYDSVIVLDGKNVKGAKQTKIYAFKYLTQSSKCLCIFLFALMMMA